MPRTWSSGPIGGTGALLRSAMAPSGERVEDDVGAGEPVRVGRFVGPGDLTVLVDQDEGAVGEPRPVDVGAIGTGDLALGLEVGEQGGVDTQLLLEGLVSKEAVDADPDQLDPLGGDLRLHLLVERELIPA